MNTPSPQPLASPFAPHAGKCGGVLALGLLLATSLAAQAATIVWGSTGATGDWNTGSNWQGGIAPGIAGTAAGNADAATFSTQGTVAHAVTDTALSREIAIINLIGTGAGGNYTIGSSSNTLYWNAAGAINFQFTNTSAIASNMTMTGSGNVGDLKLTGSSTGTLTLSGNISSSATSGTSRFLVAQSTASEVVLVSGAIQDGASGAAVAVTHSGGLGILTLTGANTFSGGFLNGSGSTGNTTQVGVDSVLSGGTLVSGAFGTGTLSFNYGQISSDGATARTIYNALDFRSGINIFGDAVNNGTLTFAGAFATSAGLSSTIQANSDVIFSNTATTTGNNQALTLSGAAHGTLAAALGANITGLVKSGAGTWTLAGATTASAAIPTINDGTLQIGINNALRTTINPVVNELTAGGTATLDLNGFNQQVNLITLGGTGAAATGMDRIINSSGTPSTLTIGSITYNATNNPLGALISVNTLDLNGATAKINTGDSANAAVDLTISSVIQNGSLQKLGFGTLLLTGANTYAGANGTLINEGAIQIGTNNALPIADGVTLSPDNAGSTATLDLNGFNQQASFLTFASSLASPVSSQVINSSGSSSTLTVGAVTYTATNNPFGALISVNTLDLNGGTVVFSIGNSTNAAYDLAVSSVIQNGGVSKTGTGTLVFSGANTYAGATTVASGGILNIRNDAALGTTVAGTTLSNTATLQLQGDITVGNEALTISGAGDTAGGATGALENVSGTNAYGGLLTLASASTISSDAGTLNLTNTGTIIGSTFGLTLTGAGDGSIAGAIGTGSGGLTKSGAGTWTLSGANTYSGATTVSGGNLRLMGAVGAGSSSTGTGAVAASGGGATTLSGTGGAKGAVTVTNGTHIAPGMNVSGANANFGAAGALSLGMTGGLTLTNASLDFDLATTAAGTSDLLHTGALTLGTLAFTFNGFGGTLDTSASYALIDGTSVTGFNAGNISTTYLGALDGLYTATYSLSGNELMVTFAAAAVPEPGTEAMLLGGLALLTLLRRRFRENLSAATPIALFE